LVFPDAHLIDADRRMLNEFRSSEGRIVPGALAPYLALEERAHVALSHTRRTARENMLMQIEVASPGLRLATVIRGRLPDRQQARRALALVGLAARGITHLGGHKGRGLGAVTIAVGAMTLDGQEVDLAGVCEELL
jgi:CRISPR/Cas system CSM-associated protein Csm3 (group 7 of RAMP superfamily)